MHIIRDFVNNGIKHTLLVHTGSEDYLIKILDKIPDDTIEQFSLVDKLPEGCLRSMVTILNKEKEE